MQNYRRKKIIAAWILASLSALPVLFIIWLSILNAEDINLSVFFPQKRNDNITFFVPQQDNQSEIAATFLGRVYEFSSHSNHNAERIVDIKSSATSYVQSGSSLWAFSANRGLVEIDLINKREKEAYDWNFFKNNYEEFDHFKFYVSGDILPEHFSWLADKLNDEPALPGDSASLTIASLTGIRFFQSEEIIRQLNWLLTPNNRALNSVLNYWKNWDGWLNPQIYSLFEIKNPTDKEKYLLFRFCLSELFPNRVSRLKYFPWQNIWVNQVASSGLSILAADDKIVMGIRGDLFPGIAIFDTQTKQLSWITEAVGLPNTSIQHIIQISDHEILATHDIGFSIIQFNAAKITHNVMFGEYDLPYLDEQNLRITTLPDNKISISYGTGSITFDFREFQTELAQEQTPMSPLISSYYENENGKWIGYGDGRFEVLNDLDEQIRAGVIPKGKRTLQWRNYQDIMRIMPLAKFFKNSALIGIAVSLICTLLAIFPSYAIARLRFLGKAYLTRILLASQVLSSLPFLIPIFVIFIILQMKSFQMFNNFTTIIFVNTIFFLPLTVQFMYDMFRAIPPNLEESAMMDGCSPWQAFRKVILPVILPAVATCLVFIFLFVWDEILFIWILSSDSSTATLPVGIRLAIGQMASRPDLLMAFSVIASIPPIILFCLVQPFLLKSLSHNND
ncbi:MAG: carbohydrate ABC transporter permease [Fibromonadaceae bacterium]|jgi:ABC-type glycerol-3-phosphate transport system permease component|nr:carbohydrate ABC transporter permease [Fibromonadaceae bacterium]